MDTGLTSDSSHGADSASKKIEGKTGHGTPVSKQHHSKTPSGAGRVSPAKRPCAEHTFLTDVADVRTMEQGLLQLLEDFHSGNLQAFGGDCTFEKMDQIRDQQECLARLHFELDLQQDMLRLDSEEARTSANENLTKLVGQLQSLSSSVQALHNIDGEPTQKKDQP